MRFSRSTSTTSTSVTAVTGSKRRRAYYFGKAIREVTLAEARDARRNCQRAEVIFAAGGRYTSYGPPESGSGSDGAERFVSGDQAAVAKAEAVALAPEPETQPELAPEVVDEVRHTLRALVGSAAEIGGYTITTTIDPSLSGRGAGGGAENRRRLRATPQARRSVYPVTERPEGVRRPSIRPSRVLGGRRRSGRRHGNLGCPGRRRRGQALLDGQPALQPERSSAERLCRAG